MDDRDLVDREILALLDMFPGMNPSLLSIAEIRAKIGETPLAPLVSTPPPDELEAPSLHGRANIRLRLYRPATARRGGGAILHLDGGSSDIASPMPGLPTPAVMAAIVGVPVVSKICHVTPERPFPMPQEDCFSALVWLAGCAPELGIEPRRLAVAGERAGGWLAASLAIMARDLGGPGIAGQLLSCPFLDCRTVQGPAGREGPSDANPGGRFDWVSLQGGYRVDDERRGWFSPSLADDLARLPPTYIVTGKLDPSFDENLDYASRLAAAGVPVELHSYSGADQFFRPPADALAPTGFNAGLLAAAAAMTMPANDKADSSSPAGPDMSA